MEILELVGVPFFKKGSGIHIKKKNRGKFTEYCGGKVTDECIRRAKKSKNPKLRKRATFAANARAWSKKQHGGVIIPWQVTKFAGGGPVDEGGYTPESREKRETRYLRYDPAGGLGPITQGLYMIMGGNKSRGEENEYWKAYLGLNNAVPKMNPKAKTSWDDKIEAEKIANGELPSDFYGTTPRMDLNIQALADTLNTGKIYRDYDKYKIEHPKLPSKRVIEKIYKTGKRVLENPNQWQQVNGDNTSIKRELDPVTNEMSPLGMLSNFGMMWNPDEKALYVHDTYDFPKWTRTLVGDRPKEMKIRGRINFDPKKGSKLLRNDMSEFNDYPDAIQ